METTITWSIIKLEREIYDGYVFTAYWRVIAQEGNHYAMHNGSLALQRPEGELIPYEDLTEEIVISWVKEKLGNDVSEYEDSLLAQIELQKNPPTATGLPW
jgi:hypothetical protein